MCAEVLSWREENWWERKSIPLGSNSFSPRQIFLLAVFGGLGDLISTPIPLAIFGIVYLGKLIPVFAALAVGFVFSSQRVKMIPLEFELFFKATKNKNLMTTESTDQIPTTGKADETEKAVTPAA